VHAARHLSERSKTPEHRAHLNAIRPLTKAWHASKEGRAVHAATGKASWSGRPHITVHCVCCGKEVLTRRPTITRFCGQNCRARFVRRGPD
jgi:hypothetical protein